MFGPCTYDHGDTYRIASELLTFLVNEYRSAQYSEKAKDRLLEELPKKIVQVGPFIKHPSFAVEREWRIVTTQLGPAQLDVRSVDGRMASFSRIDISLPLCAMDDNKAVIVSGPGAHETLSSYAMQVLSTRELGANVGLGRTSLELRQG